jgi:hypothetical protein
MQDLINVVRHFNRSPVPNHKATPYKFTTPSIHIGIRRRLGQDLSQTLKL